MEKLYTSKTFLKMAGGWVHTLYPTPLDPPVAISYRNLQKIFQSLGIISFVLFYLKAELKGGNGTMPS